MSAVQLLGAAAGSVAVLATAGGGVYATVISQRANRRANALQSTVEAAKNATENRRLDGEQFQTIIDELRKTIADVERRRGEDRTEFANTLDVQREALHDMRTELDTEHAQRILGNAYVRTVHTWAIEHARKCPGLLPPPAPPTGLDLL